MKSLLAAILLFSYSSFASINSGEVPLQWDEDRLVYQNIPTITKLFSEAKNKDELATSQQICQDWVAGKVNVLATPRVFTFFCNIKKDVALRKYIVTGSILLKNW